MARILKTRGLDRLSALEPQAPQALRDQGPRSPLHLDIKKLACFRKPGHRVIRDRKDRNRSPGWSYVFAVVDDCSRVAYVEVKGDERKESAASFLLSILRHYRRMGIRIRMVMTDIAKIFQSMRFQKVLGWLGLKHKTTPPYTPRVNGKVERFIRTLLNEWAYAHAYQSSDEREACPPDWLYCYDWHRPHSSLGNQPPSHAWA